MTVFYLRIDPPFRDGELPSIQEQGELIMSFKDFVTNLDWEVPPSQCLLIDTEAKSADDVTQWVANHFGQLSFDNDAYQTDEWGAFFNEHKAAWADEEYHAEGRSWERHKTSFSRPLA